MGKDKKNKILPKSQHQSRQDDYNVSNSFSRVKKYRGSNPIQTEPNYEGSLSFNPNIIDNASYPQVQETITSVDRNDYYNLDNKITALTSQNIEAHEGLRKEFENKLEKVSDRIAGVERSQKSFWKWFVGIAIPVLIAFGTWLYNRLSLSNENREYIEKLEYKIEETVIPLLDKQANQIEKNTTEIRELSSSSKRK